MGLRGAEGLPPAAVGNSVPGLTPQGFPAAPLGPRSRASDHEARAGDPHRLRAPRPKGRRVRGKKRRVSSARRERAAAATSEPRLTARPCPAPRLTEPDVTRRDASAGKPLRMRRRGRPAEPCRSARGSARGREAERGEMGSGRSSGGGGGVGRACAASRALGRDPGPRWGCRAGSAGLWHRGGGWGHREVRSEPAGGFPGSPSWRGGGGGGGRRGAGGGRACWRAAMGRARLGCPSGRAAARGGLLFPVWARNSQQEFWKQKVLLAYAK